MNVIAHDATRHHRGWKWESRLAPEVTRVSEATFGGIADAVLVATLGGGPRRPLVNHPLHYNRWPASGSFSCLPYNRWPANGSFDRP